MQKNNFDFRKRQLVGNVYYVGKLGQFKLDPWEYDKSNTVLY